MVALDKEVRDAASKAEKIMDEFSVEMEMRKDIFDNLVAFRWDYFAMFKRGNKRIIFKKVFI